ncbi:MAG: GTPase Era [Myxococcales bacterium 68-20]|nr:GTPase Era [Myxococcales bacterium]OJY17921.1 MAG: GTPase Era [Myxococcales bacterium 68-20]
MAAGATSTNRSSKRPHPRGTGAPRPNAKAEKADKAAKAANAPKAEPRSERARPEKAQPRPEKARPRSGTIALIGRPNVGKSTLLNAMLGTRLAITSHHPQTTRDRIAGILTEGRTQFVFLDTPGLHKPKNRLGQRMNDLATGTAADADVVLFVVDIGPAAAAAAAAEVRPDDVEAVRAVPEGTPVILVVNKIDRIAEKQKLLEVLPTYSALRDFAAIVPISAKKRDGTKRLLKEIENLLPEGEHLYPEDELSDRPVRFFVGELVREQVLMRTRQEVPHGVAVTVDAFEEGKKLTRITISVHVAKESHKGIIIGQGGKMLAAVGTAARERAERLLGQKVHLDVRVKTTPGWFDDAARLVDLGYSNEDGKPKKKAPKAPSRTKQRGLPGDTRTNRSAE